MWEARSHDEEREAGHREGAGGVRRDGARRGPGRDGPAAGRSAGRRRSAATGARRQAGDAVQAAHEGKAGQDAETDAPGLDETKRKFKEALERKHQAHNESQGKGGKDGGKISGAHGPAASRRSFRRKSG